MTLYRQLIVIVSMLFIAGFVGSFTISSSNLRHFLDKQLASHAQDTATSLGLSLSQAVQNNDQAVMEAMIDAVFDRGYYQQVELTAVGGERLVERSNPVRIENVPGGFVRHMAIETPEAEALVMAGWRQAAIVQVRSHPGHAYRELWQNTVDIFRMFALMAVTVIFLGLVAIRIMLRPLRRVESQASAICSGSFPVQEKLPRTRELRRIVEAMNRVSRSIDESFSKHASLTEQLHEEAYLDPLTGLGNRRWFDQQLQFRLTTQEGVARGTLILVALQQLDRINAESGYQAGDRLLQRIAELVGQQASHHADCQVARISGAEFGLIVTNIDVSEAETLASTIASDLSRVGPGESSGTAGVVHIGMTMWEQGDTAGDLLAEADIALRTARSSGESSWHRYKPAGEADLPARGTTEWRHYLRKVIASGDIGLFMQYAYTLPDSPPREMHCELLARVADDGNNPVPAGLFMPVAERLGLASEIDRIIVRQAIQRLEARQVDEAPLAVNLSASSLHDEGFMDWLHQILGDSPATQDRLLFELPESAIAANGGRLISAIERLDAAGYGCGIDNFGHSFRSLAQLRSLKIRYLKMDGSYTREIDRDAGKQFFVRALCDTAHSIDIQVIASAVETMVEAEMLARLNVDGVQGHLYSKPVPA